MGKKSQKEVVESAPVEVEKTKKDKKEKKEKKNKENKRPIEEVADVVAVPEKKAKGDWFEKNHVKVSGAEIAACETFDMAADIGFPKKLWKACKKKFPNPTPIQAVAWPLMMQGKDMCAIAKTGSGKTLAFVLPFLAQSEKGTLECFAQPSSYARMVCMAPTRELAMQIEEVATEFSAKLNKEGASSKYSVCCLVGGMPKWEQKQAIQKVGCDILIATPGRLQDLADEGVVNLSSVQFLVLDEADRMLDQGFVLAVRKIVSLMPKKRQTVCFSATWPTSVHRLANELMEKPVTITVGSATDQSEAGCGEDGQLRANEDVLQIVEVMNDDRRKFERVQAVLREHKGQRIIIFALYKKEAARLEEQLYNKGYSCVAIQGDMTQEKRTRAIEDFKNGAKEILIATDVASRGLDVKGVQLVINYTFPLTVEDYVHRIGRTGRGGSKGKAITFFNLEGNHKEKEHAFGLVRVLEKAKQQVPPKLAEVAGNTFTATKKKEHPVYGKFFKDEAEMKKLEEKKVHMTFADSDDE